MKKALGLIAASLLMATPVLAAEAEYNCDYQPSCEVAPGIYGKMSNPVTSKFKLSLGGYVKFDYAYNSVNFGPSGAISPGTGAIPAPNITAQRFQTQEEQSIFTMRQSRLWGKVDGPTFLGAKTSALVEGDFYGDPSAPQESPQFRLRLAYGALDWANTQVLFGQQWDIFAPMVASTQDFRSGAPYGAPNTPRSPQIRLTQKINLNADNQIKIVLGMQDPEQFGNNSNIGNPGAAGFTATTNWGTNLNYAGQIMYINKSLGVAPGYFGMSMNPLTVGVFGLYGREHIPADLNQLVDSWGYGVYTFVPVLKSKDGKSRAMTMSMEGQAYLAANQTFNGATASATVGPTTNQKAARSWAATGQVIFYPTQELGITGGWGARYAFNNGDYTIANGANIANYQKLTQEIYANATYDLNAAIRVAVEYQNMKTVYGNANDIARAENTGNDNTVRFCAYYFF